MTISSRIHPETDWMSCLEHAEKLGMGTREYELVKIDRLYAA